MSAPTGWSAETDAKLEWMRRDPQGYWDHSYREARELVESARRQRAQRLTGWLRNWWTR